MSQSQVKRCSKCGGEVREGELFINVTSTPGSGLASPYSYPSEFAMGMQSGSMVSGDGPFWRERTGKKEGLLFKREKTQTLKICGYRCKKCGYIELFAYK